MGAERQSEAGANAWAAAALAMLAALYLVLFRPGYSVMGGGDFALYLAHAQAIATFQPYAATGFVFNPANAIMSPAAYPPGLPLLLAPLVAVFGIELTGVRLEGGNRLRVGEVEREVAAAHHGIARAKQDEIEGGQHR